MFLGKWGKSDERGFALPRARSTSSATGCFGQHDYLAVKGQLGEHRIQRLPEGKCIDEWGDRTRDPNDDMVLEVAVAAGCRYLVTFNKGDFASGHPFAIRVVTPREFLQAIEVFAFPIRSTRRSSSWHAARASPSISS